MDTLVLHLFCICENGAAASNPAKRRKRSSDGAVAGDGGGGVSSSGEAADGGGANVGDEVEEGFEDIPLSSAGKGKKKKKGKGKPGKSKRGGGSGSSTSSSVGDSGGDQGAGAGMEKWAETEAKEREREARKEEVVAGHMVRERRLLSLHRLVASLDQLDRMIAWVDDVEEDVNAKQAGVLGPGMPMSVIGFETTKMFEPDWTGLL
ncbi:unnamed protein product [Ectocarpus sp. CCAP 1310/34]|nr:unnamed protein product [Ectocarpus sp. CCAP 1310/34]